MLSSISALSAGASLDLRTPLLVSGVVLAAVIGYVALRNGRLQWKTVASLMVLLVLHQLLLKVSYRFFIPGFSERAGDETVWLNQMLLYQRTGVIPVSALPQGPGLFVIVNSLSPLFGGQYVETLTGIALIFGSLCIIPVFAMQYSFTGSPNLALLATVVVANFDVIAYSTSIARPTLLAMFLIPLLAYLFVEFRKSKKTVLWVSFVILSLTLMFTHSIGWVVFLVVIFSVWLLLGFKSWLEIVGAVALFSSYAIALRFLLLDAYRIWSTELLAQTPLTKLGPDLLAVMFIIPALLLLLVEAVRKSVHMRLRPHSFKFDILARRTATVLVICAGAVALSAVAYAVLTKYAGYLQVTYGGLWLFFALSSWKIVIAAIALYGIVGVVPQKGRGEGSLVALIWLLSVGILVLFLIAYLPYRNYPGLFNLDERFSEFAVFPAMTFVAYGLDDIFRKVGSPIVRVLIIVLFSAFVVPSLLVGMRDPMVIHAPP